MPRRPIHVGLLATALAAVAVTAAACGGSSPAVASLGGTTTTTTLATPTVGGGGGPKGNPTAYATCMRAHGVANFPDPVVTGNSISIRIDPSITGSPHFASAQTACAHFLPALGKGGPPTITPADQEDYLKAAACMRSHGVVGFPDPIISNGNVRFEIPSTINPNSATVQHAITVCRKLIPAGLPYSH